jgi:hypothetical protein
MHNHFSQEACIIAANCILINISFFTLRVKSLVVVDINAHNFGRIDVLFLWLCFHVDTQYHFNERDRDWGFTSFIPFSELFDPSRGYLVKNSLVVEVEVTCNVGEKENEDQYTYIKVL